MAWLLLTFLVTLGAALSSVGGVRVRELDPGIQAGVGWGAACVAGILPGDCKVNPSCPGGGWRKEGRAQLRFGNVALIPLPTPPQHICTWFTVNESPVLMDQAWAPFPSCPGPGTQTQAPPCPALSTGSDFSQFFPSPLEGFRALIQKPRVGALRLQLGVADGNGDVNGGGGRNIQRDGESEIPLFLPPRFVSVFVCYGCFFTRSSWLL